ncbi:MAG: hypothetical protein R3F13_03355 [Prosthecobacter sp.]
MQRAESAHLSALCHKTGRSKARRIAMDVVECGILTDSAMETPPSIPGSVMPPPAPAPAPKSGGGKWVLIGCGGCLTLLVLCGLFAAGIFWTVSGAIKSSDAYQEALKRAQ